MRGLPSQYTFFLLSCDNFVGTGTHWCSFPLKNRVFTYTFMDKPKIFSTVQLTSNKLTNSLHGQLCITYCFSFNPNMAGTSSGKEHLSTWSVSCAFGQSRVRRHEDLVASYPNKLVSFKSFSNTADSSRLNKSLMKE